MPQSSLERRVLRRIARAHLAIDDPTRERLVNYFDLLARWNQRMNLTARVDTDEAVDRLIVEPVLAARFLPTESFRLMDVGSGGGSPAIPMKLMSPGMRLWMVESKVRKSAFLREAVRHLALGETVVETQRVEQLLIRSEFEGSIDIVSMRAVRMDTRLLSRLTGALTPSGSLFLFVGASNSGRGRFGPDLVVARRERLLDGLRSELLIVNRRERAAP